MSWLRSIIERPLQLRDRFRVTRRRFQVWYEHDGLTQQELEERARHMDQITEMIKHPGWNVFRDTAKDRIDDVVEATYRLKPEEWQGPKGLEMKGRAEGRMETLNVIAEIISKGVDARTRLDKTKRELNVKSRGRRVGAEQISAG